jgi:soluble lytic murein transglycosylase-like protein
MERIFLRAHTMAKVFLPFFGVLVFSGSACAFCFEEAGERYGVSPAVLWAIAKTESSFDPAARHHNRNGTVDVGLMQINSLWAPRLGETWNRLDDPCINVMTGAWILRHCLEDFGNTWQAVGCYHSRTPEKSQRYAARVASILQRQGLLPAGHDSR